MQRLSTLVRTLGLVSVVGIATLVLPLQAHASGVHVDFGLHLPLPPFPFVVAPPPPVVYSPPVVVGTGYYGYARYPYGYWRRPYRVYYNSGAYYRGGWRHHHHHRHHRWQRW